MKARRRCPKCQATDIRNMAVRLDSFDYGPGEHPTFSLRRYRFTDAYTCAGCGFVEFYLRK